MNLGGTIRLNRTGLCVLIGMFIILILYATSGKKDDSDLAKVEKEISLKQLLHCAIEAAERGGHEIRNLKGPLDIKSKGKTKEGLNDSVTNADLKSHCVMYGSLKQTFPHIKVVSEEKHACDSKDLKIDVNHINKFNAISDTIVPVDEVTVWIDPLDATYEYTGNLLQYVTTMVCVAVKGKPIIGVIHKPFLNKTSWAWDSKLKSLDLQKTIEETSDKPKVIISLSHGGDVEDVIKKAFGNDVTIIKAAGAGYKSLEVASGNASVYFHTTSIKKWDICAGNAILNALGGKMTTRLNDEIDYSDAAVGQVVNIKGLIGTVTNHDMYIEKLGSQKMQ